MRYLSLLLFSLAVPASAQVDLTEFVTFGDSLTHNDLLGQISDIPQDTYGLDPFQAAFEKAKLAGDDIHSYAVGGSESSHLITQVNLYHLMVALGGQAPATTIGMQIGGNDIRNNRGLLAAHAPGTDEAADAIIDDLINNLAIAFGLAYSNDRQFIIWTVPRIVLTPDHADEFTLGGKRNLRHHTERANDAIWSLASMANVAVYDLDAGVRRMSKMPRVLYGHGLITVPFFGGYDHVFADDLHLTAVTNAILANGILASMRGKWGLSVTPYYDDELADLAHISQP